MLKILVWNVAKDTGYFDGALKILERQHNGIELVGVTASAETSLVYDGKKVPFIPLDKVDRAGKDYDVLLVVGAKLPLTGKATMSDVTKMAIQLKLPEEKLLGDWIVTIPGFTLEKYRTLQRSRLSIFSVNCFGGALLNRLGLPFLSPFVNLFLSNSDFIKFLHKPHEYIKETLVHQNQNFNKMDVHKFPIVECGDIVLKMLHYKTFDESVDAWERRKKLINWDNIFVITVTESEEVLQEFDALPYTKKACFVPFKSDLDSAWYINPDIDKDTPKFATIFLDFSRGKYFYYDLFDMLLYGKKTPLIDM